MPNDMTPNEGNYSAAKQFSRVAPDPDADIHDETQAEFEAKLAQHGGSVDALLVAEDAESDVQEEMREREQTRRDDANDADREKKEGQTSGFNKAANGEKADGDASGVKYEGSHLKDFVSYGISDKGSYYKFNNEKVSDKQLRRMLIRAASDHPEWNTIYFYDKKGKIDGQLTQRARDMIDGFGASKSEGLRRVAASFQISPVSMTSVEPFHAGNPLKHLSKFMEKQGRKWSAAKAEWVNTGAPIPGSKGASKLVSV